MTSRRLRRQRHEWWGLGLDKRQARRERRRHAITCPICRGRFRGYLPGIGSALFSHVYFDHDYELENYGPAVRHVLNVGYAP